MKASQLFPAAAAAFLLFLAAPAFSQTCGPGIGPCGGNGSGPGYGPGMMGRGGPGGPGGWGDPAAHAESRLESLHAQLNLAPSQAAAWDAYAAAVRSQAGDMAQDRAAMSRGGLTAPERAAKRAQLMAAHAAGHAKVADALKSLYEGLDPTQRATIDRYSMQGNGRFARR